MTRTSHCVVVFSALICATSHSTARSQVVPRPVGIHVTKHSMHGMDAYELLAPQFVGNTLIAPDGTTFTPGAGAGPITGLSLSDLASRFAGQWTLSEQPNSENLQHQFEVPPSVLTEGYLPIPTVISPTEGAVVPQVFEAIWEDGVPGLDSYRLNGLQPSDSRRIGDGRFEFTAMLPPGESSRQLTFTAFAAEIVQLPTATPLAPFPARMYGPFVLRSIASAPRTFTVAVPEPSAPFPFLLAVIGLQSISCRRN
jgi:hypothetical protein